MIHLLRHRDLLIHGELIVDGEFTYPCELTYPFEINKIVYMFTTCMFDTLALGHWG